MKLPAPDEPAAGPAVLTRFDGWYLYGVLPADNDIDLGGRGHPVQLVRTANLYALVGRVARSRSPEANSQDTNSQDTNSQDTNSQDTNPQDTGPQDADPQDTAFPGADLQDPEQLTALIHAHDQVLRDAVATGRAVVPMPFGLVAETLEKLHRLIGDHSSELHAALARLEGCDEWGVHVSVPREAAQRAVRSCARQVYERLAAVAEDAVIEPVNAGAKESRPSILSAAYLVNRDRLAAFTRMTADLQQAWNLAGFTIGVSGPWPAYNFARVRCGGEQAEQARVLLGPLSEPGGSWPTS
jgi:hypothetical protein